MIPCSLFPMKYAMYFVPRVHVLHLSLMFEIMRFYVAYTPTILIIHKNQKNYKSQLKLNHVNRQQIRKLSNQNFMLQYINLCIFRHTKTDLGIIQQSFQGFFDSKYPGKEVNNPALHEQKFLWYSVLNFLSTIVANALK